MVYESDFYTTRRTRPTVSSYSVTRRRVPEHLAPTMLRVGEVQTPYTAFGRCERVKDDQSGLNAMPPSGRRTFRSVAPDLPSHVYSFYRYYRH